MVKKIRLTNPSKCKKKPLNIYYNLKPAVLNHSTTDVISKTHTKQEKQSEECS